MEKISVVMAAYNEPVWMVDLAIESILNQTYPDIELIVVMDNPENMKLIIKLKEYKDKIKLIINEKNRGLPYSLNRGIRAAAGRIIARMDSDDISIPARLEIEYGYLTSNSYDIISSDISYIDEEGNNLDIPHIVTSDPRKLIRRLRHVNCMSHPTYMFTIDAFNKTGGYKRELKAAQDYEFVNNAISKGLKIGLCNQKLLKYRIRGDNISQSKNDLQRFLTYYVRKVYVQKKRYSAAYIEKCFVGENLDYIQFSTQYKRYQNETNGLNGFKKRIKQAGLFICLNYVRSILYHDFVYKMLVRLDM